MNAFTQDPGEQEESQSEAAGRVPQGIVIPPEMIARFRGEQGEAGEQGEKGDKGDPGESHLVPLAQQLVKDLVDGAKRSQDDIAVLDKTVSTLRKVIAALIVLFMATGSIAGYLLNENLTHPLSNRLTTQAQEQAAEIKALEAYVQAYAQHGCSALELLSSKPVPKPADPAANPSRETTYEFYEAIVHWEQLDGCKTS